MRRMAFTLIELMVVVVIIMILAGISLPTISMARRKGADAACRNNLRQIGTALYRYATSHSDSRMPGDTNSVSGPNVPYRWGSPSTTLFEELEEDIPIATDASIWFCPRYMQTTGSKYIGDRAAISNRLAEGYCGYAYWAPGMKMDASNTYWGVGAYASLVHNQNDPKEIPNVCVLMSDRFGVATDATAVGMEKIQYHAGSSVQNVNLTEGGTHVLIQGNAVLLISPTQGVKF